MERQVLKNTIYSHIKDLSDFEKSKIDNYKIIKLDFGDYTLHVIPEKHFVLLII